MGKIAYGLQFCLLMELWWNMIFLIMDHDKLWYLLIMEYDIFSIVFLSNFDFTVKAIMNLNSLYHQNFEIKKTWMRKFASTLDFLRRTRLLSQKCKISNDKILQLTVALTLKGWIRFPIPLWFDSGRNQFKCMSNFQNKLNHLNMSIESIP